MGAESKRRRSRGEGSITQIRRRGVDGATADLWMGRVTVAPGRRRSVYGRTKSETLAKMREALRQAERGEPAPDTRVTVAAFLREWLAGPAERSLRVSTLRTYRLYVERHIIPAIGHHRLIDLRPDHVDAMLGRLSRGKKPLSPHTRQQIRAIVRSALSWGERNGRVVRNAAKLSTPVRVPPRELKPLTAEEARKLVAAAEGDPLGALYVLALDTGLRQGELLGLRWEDIDLERRELRVVQVRESVKGPPRFGEPKTEKSRRAVAFGEVSARLLERHRDLRELGYDY